MDAARKKLAIAGATGLLALGVIGGAVIAGGDDEPDQEVRILPVAGEVEVDETTTTEAVEASTAGWVPTTVVTTTQAPTTTEALPVTSSPPPTDPPATTPTSIFVPDPATPPECQADSSLYGCDGVLIDPYGDAGPPPYTGPPIEPDPPTPADCMSNPGLEGC